MLILAVIAAQVADLFTFICAASVLPIDGEGNPIARHIYTHWGFPGVIAYKAVGTVVICATLSVLHQPLQAIGVVTIVALTLAAAGTNTLAVVLTR